MRKNCSIDQEKLLNFLAEGREFATFLRSLGQFIQTVKQFLKQNAFLTCSWRLLRSKTIIIQMIGAQKPTGKVKKTRENIFWNEPNSF